MNRASPPKAAGAAAAGAAAASEPVVWRLRKRAGPGLGARLAAALGRFAYLTLCGLVLGGIVHIATVLLVPRLSQNDAALRFGDLGAAGKAERIDAAPDSAAMIIDHDPATVIAACGYDLAEGPLRVTARTGATPMALAILPRGGGVAYAITDRAAIRGVIDFIVLTPTQLADRAGREDDGETTRELRVTLTKPQGIVIARALARRPSDHAEAEALVSDVVCGAAD